MTNIAFFRPFITHNPIEIVCCPSYCASEYTFQSCSTAANCDCTTPPPAMFKSGTIESWHNSRSTNFGLTSGGACGFGLYSLCAQGSVTASWTDAWLGDTYTAFCTSYPMLCKDPSNTTLRGNFAAPNGDYYTQDWPSLPGGFDNYLSDRTHYAVGEAGYTDPIVLEVVDSCPCNTNSNGGPGADHGGEINFKYGCPLPVGSILLDLSDIAMGRISSVVSIEVQGTGTTTWTSLIHDPNHTESRPQERYGSWTIPQGTGPFELPVAVRITSPSGEQVVSMDAITTFIAPASTPAGFYYIDLGVQFSS
ncbi:uncharacterized protein LY89DRAFT_695754 [Mollisia scopiformis]|uniref:Uncharacterized protein n=1 Tax=Mollisia scopiformis TaxID=149040 RepID=A0A194XFY0_MOLSC|nr:uncharacterized protein LY89DRAFT_695754 [Mollisia scopiformis]KUJ19078.1 hypothetical protein LY89DRAFT_695754 [Mollisia scopiformis]